MIARIFFHLVNRDNPTAVKWLQNRFDTPAVSCLSMSDGAVQVEARKDGKQKSLKWTSDDLLLRLQEDQSASVGALAWTLCKFQDILDETNDMLHDYVKSQIGLRLENVLFFVKGDYLMLRCSRQNCSGRQKESTNVQVTQADDGRICVKIPLINSDLRELLFGRLRRKSL